MTIIASLPEIVQREVMFPKLNDKDQGLEIRKTTIARLISMLAVNFINEQDKSLAMAEFGTFLRDYSLTSQEVIEAYRMALKKQLQNIKGETINVYPNLSLIQAGEILNAYSEYKIQNSEHTRGINLLKAMTSKKEASQTPAQIREELLKLLFAEIAQDRYSSDAWLLFEELEEAGKIAVAVPVKKRLYQRALAKHKADFERELKISSRGAILNSQIKRDFEKSLQSGGPIRSVVNRCRSIVVSNYLRKHLSDFETFKNAIHGQEMD